MSERKMQITIKKDTATLINKADLLDADIQRLQKNNKDSNYTRYLIHFDFLSHFADKTDTPYFSIVALANAGHIKFLRHTLRMKSLLPDETDKGVDLYSVKKPGDYFNSAFDMVKGFFASNAYKQSKWHMSPQYYKLMTQKKQLEAKMNDVDKKLNTVKGIA